MKKLLGSLFLTTFISFTVTSQDVYVDGYLRKNGVYVPSHFRTAPNYTMLDNYSTKGNYNPYTGKPGWIEPYEKVSSLYFNQVPAYKDIYKSLFNYLTKKDSINFYNTINLFSYEYKTFFGGLYRYQSNYIKAAYDLFERVVKIKSEDSFISEEGLFWFNMCSRILESSDEIEALYSFLESNGIDQKFDTALRIIDRIRNPLNYHDKYKWKVIFEIKTKNFEEAIRAEDSLFTYSVKTDSAVTKHNDLKEWLSAQKDYKSVAKDGNYELGIPVLYNLLSDFVTNSFVPSKNELAKAAFKPDPSFNKSQLVFKRYLINPLMPDTSILEHIKYDTLPIKTYDTLTSLRILFFDSLIFNNYFELLEKFKRTQSLSKSLGFKNINATGKEYFINKQVVGGLIVYDNPKSYEMYFYCFANKGKLRDLSFYFPETNSKIPLPKPR